MFPVSGFFSAASSRRLRLALCATVVAAALMAAPAAQAEETRTTGRTVSGLTIYPKHFFATPEHYEFLPLTSNHDPHHQHPQQWDGQEWDPAGWNADWTPEKTLNRLFENRTFAKQYMGGSKHVHNKKFQAHIPVLEVGPTFYKLSDLDRRRSLKLLADYTDVFGKGYEMIELRDWRSHETIGSYTPKGMFLH
jgi:hypothetical protein